MINYGEALKEQRQNKNLSLNDVREKTGISSQNLSRWERGEVIPNIDFCVQLAQFYGVTLDELVGLTDPTTPTQSQHALSTHQNSKAISFTTEYADIIDDNNFISISKLYKAITPELRALILGYLIGLLQSNGVNTESILKY